MAINTTDFEKTALMDTKSSPQSAVNSNLILRLENSSDYEAQKIIKSLPAPFDNYYAQNDPQRLLELNNAIFMSALIDYAVLENQYEENIKIQQRKDKRKALEKLNAKQREKLRLKDEIKRAEFQRVLDLQDKWQNNLNETVKNLQSHINNLTQQIILLENKSNVLRDTFVKNLSFKIASFKGSDGRLLFDTPKKQQEIENYMRLFFDEAARYINENPSRGQAKFGQAAFRQQAGDFLTINDLNKIHLNIIQNNPRANIDAIKDLSHKDLVNFFGQMKGVFNNENVKAQVKEQAGLFKEISKIKGQLMEVKVGVENAKSNANQLEKFITKQHKIYSNELKYSNVDMKTKLLDDKLNFDYKDKDVGQYLSSQNLSLDRNKKRQPTTRNKV